MIRALYRKLRETLETKLLGTRFTELVWRTRHLYKKGWSQQYLSSSAHLHRAQIVAEVSAFFPFMNVLEVGCASGPNLLLLSEKFLQANFYGVDINADGIRTLAKHVDEKAIGNIKCSVAKVDSLEFFQDDSMDVVFTDALLMFIGRDKIDKVIKEIGRVAKRGMIFNEFHSDFPPPNNYEGGRYVHNYKRIIAEHFPNANVSIKNSTFAGGQWDKYGSLIRVKL